MRGGMEFIMYILTLPLLVVCLLTLPVIGAIKRKGPVKKLKTAFMANLCVFFGVLLMGAIFPIGMSAFAETSEETGISASSEESPAADNTAGYAYIAAALAVGLGSIGCGIAVAAAAPAAIGAVSEDQKTFPRALIFVALGEGVALYGFLISYMIVNKF